MNRKYAKAILPLIQAYAEGKTIQIHRKVGDILTNPPKWDDAGEPMFALPASRYRIKPEARTIWLNEYIHEGVSTFFGHETLEKAKLASNEETLEARHKIIIPPKP